MKRIVYMAARYGRRLELCEKRYELEATGRFSVRARWLLGSHQIDDSGNPLGDDGERAVEADTPDAARARRKFLKDDVEDVMACDMLIAFTEGPRAKASRGGRHVELGIALARQQLRHGSHAFEIGPLAGVAVYGPTIVIIGPRENLFCWSPSIIQFDRWEDFMETIDGRR